MFGTSGRVDLVATYIADVGELGDDASPSAVRQLAEAFATGQSIGTWLPVPGITPQMRALHGAEVLDARPLENGETIGGETATDARGSPRRSRPFVLRIAFPVKNFGAQFPMLFTTLLGNDPSTSLPVRLVDIDLADDYADAFGGPRFGIAGWRDLTGARGRPILLNMIKPCTGYPPEVGVDFVEAVARGGCDLIKDDELLGDPSFNRVAERSRLYRDRLERVAQETGHRSRYMANITTREPVLMDTARAAIDGGADALMINALAVGLDAVQMLAEAGLGVPLFAHTAGIEVFSGDGLAGFGRALLIGRLLRLAGADAILTDNPYGRRPPPMTVTRAAVTWMRDSWGSLARAAPVIGGGVTADMVRPIVAEFGRDLILAAGGAIQGHPGGAAVGARAMLDAIEAAVGVTAPAERDQLV
jgi:2,3-diketo-5-methylthiopentyl-1-phosphate enolase